MYFLFCKDEENDEDSVYIGEAENVKDRLLQHLRDAATEKEKYYFEDSLNVKISDLEKNPDAYNDLFEDKKVLISKFKNGNVFVDLSSYAYENTYEEFYDIIRKKEVNK